jgi:hypothetical protein
MTAARRVVLGTNYSSVEPKTVWVFDGALTLKWTANHGAQVNAVAIAPDGRVAIGGNRIGTITTRVYDIDGNELWTADHGASVLGVAFDGDGHLTAVGTRATGSSNKTLRTYDEDGTEVSTLDMGATVYAVTLAADTVSSAASERLAAGNNYAATGDSGQARQYRANDTRKWTLQTEGSSRSIRAATCGHAGGVGSAEYGNFFVAGTRVDSKTTLKYNISRSLQWHQDDGGQCNGLALGDDHAALAVGFNRNSNLSLRVRDPDDGAELWTADTGANVLSVAIDADGYVYAATDSLSVGSLRRYAADGSAFIAADLPLANVTFNWTFNCRAVAVRDFAIPDQVALPPGLPLPLALGVPVGTGVLFAPGLPLRLALAAPTPVVPLPPFGTGQPLYRAYVGAGASLTDLPIISLQCRRRRTASTWMVLVTDTAAPMDAIPVGGTLVVYAGERDGDGVETRGLFLTGIITEVETEETSDRPTRRITARVQADLDPIQPRTLVGVRAIRTDGGRPSAQATVDPRLRPGDTVVVGADSWTAYRIDYTLSAADAVMNVFGDPV